MSKNFIKLFVIFLILDGLSCTQNKEINLKKTNSNSILSVSAVLTHKMFLNPGMPIFGSVQVIGGVPPIICRWAIMENGQEIASLGASQAQDGFCKTPKPFVSQRPGHYQLLTVVKDNDGHSSSSAATTFVTFNALQKPIARKKDCLADGHICSQTHTGSNCYTVPGSFGGFSQECLSHCCSDGARSECEMEKDCPGKINCTYYCQTQ